MSGTVLLFPVPLSQSLSTELHQTSEDPNISTLPYFCCCLSFATTEHKNLLLKTHSSEEWFVIKCLWAIFTNISAYCIAAQSVCLNVSLLQIIARNGVDNINSNLNLNFPLNCRLFADVRFNVSLWLAPVILWYSYLHIYLTEPKYSNAHVILACFYVYWKYSTNYWSTYVNLSHYPLHSSNQEDDRYQEAVGRRINIMIRRW